MSFVAEEKLQLVETAAVERYLATPHQIVRSVERRTGEQVQTSVDRPTPIGLDSRNAFNWAWLRSRIPMRSEGPVTTTVVDLFAGCGGLSLGVEEAARALGMKIHTLLAADLNVTALDVLAANFDVDRLESQPIQQWLDGEVGEGPTRSERTLRSELDGLDLVIGGPPCQGHSDLNNHTRRDDPKNQLYMRMARFIEIVRPVAVIIENVPGVAHDRRGVVAATVRLLRELGYFVDTGVIRADDVGASQARRRHLLLAHRHHPVSVNDAADQVAAPACSVDWAIGDLRDRDSSSVFDSPARHSPTNKGRIQYLFDHGLYELPNSERPDCHRLKPHSYVSVYGRMHGDRPAPTITSGFGSTGQGRFVHPHEPRTLTPHEAARLQGFPDWYDFSGVAGRRALQEMIGNAVPSRLAYAAALHVLR